MVFPNVSPDVNQIPYERNFVVLLEVVLGGCLRIGCELRSSRIVRMKGGWLYVVVVSCANLSFCPSLFIVIFSESLHGLRSDMHVHLRNVCFELRCTHFVSHACQFHRRN